MNGDGDDAPAEGGHRVQLCLGPNCSPRGSGDLLPILQAAVERAGLTASVEVLATTCRSRCEHGPSMNVYPGPVFYNAVTEEAIEEIVQTHLVHGRVADRWLFRGSVEERESTTAVSIASALDRYFG
ncbi:MAG: (2Fe-2S) ferredoxin domain-containing protein, partial [Thermomicrobiales bacterium]